MREVSARLDRVEALEPGTGQLDLGLVLRPGWAGAGVAYEHRWTDRVSGYLGGRAGYGWGAMTGWVVEADGGIRVRF